MNRPRTSRGQSVTEFALILPLMMMFLGATIDVARVFQAWISIESAARDAAEQVATSAQTSSAALDQAKTVVCPQVSGLPGYTAGSGTNPCTSPTVTIVSFARSTTAAGASNSFPVASVTVRVELPFQTLFPYPFLTQGGAWTIGATESFSVVQGR